MSKKVRGHEQHTAAHFKNVESYHQMQRKQHRRTVLTVVVVLLVLVVVGAGGFLAWANLPVTVTVNGSESKVSRNSTVAAVFEQTQPRVAAGDFLAVDGSVITSGTEDAYEVTVERSGSGSQTLDPEQAASFSVSEGDNIVFSDGEDVTEEYTSTQRTEEPQLTMTGTEGIVFYVSQWGKQGIIETRTGSVSGKTAEVVIQQKQDAVVTRATPTPANGEKLVALTFDDGPSTYTESYLDILDQYGVKATFFLIGEQVDYYPDAIKRAVSEGHQIASHTWDHKQLTTLTQSELERELGDTFSAITDVTGLSVSTVRPPYGSIDPDVWLYSGGSMTVATFWTHDTQDWAQPGVSSIVSNATTYYASGSIILMHDGGGSREQDLEALPQIIEAWQSQGYRFVTLSELLDSDPNIPDDIASGNAQMPEDAVWPTSFSDESIDNGIA